MLNIENNDKTKLIINALKVMYQNLNSGKRRINGRNSSVDFVGKFGASSSSSTSDIAGSSFGVKNNIS